MRLTHYSMPNGVCGRLFIDLEIRSQLLGEAGDLTDLKVDDEIQIIRGARLSL